MDLEGRGAGARRGYDCLKSARGLYEARHEVPGEGLFPGGEHRLTAAGHVAQDVDVEPGGPEQVERGEPDAWLQLVDIAGDEERDRHRWTHHSRETRLPEESARRTARGNSSGE